MILYVRLQNTLWILMLQFHAISATMTIQNRLFFWVEPQLGQAFAIFLPVSWQPPPWAVLSQELKYIEKLCCIAFSRVSETDRDRDRGHTDFIQSMKIFRTPLILEQRKLWDVIILTTKQNTNPVLIEANRYSMNGHVWRATTASTTPCELFHPIQNHPESLDLRQT